MKGSEMPVDRHSHVGPDDDPDKYRLLRQVGSGGEAALWEADMSLAGGRERVAMKILRAELADDAARWRERWAEQVELLRLIHHPAVVGVHSHFAGARMHPPGQANPHDRALYLVMNWVEGQDLREWVLGHTRPEDRVEALRYLLQIADALDWLHSGHATPSGRPVVHGDISPGNVVISDEGQAVLVDFGLVRVARHITEVHAGTPGYCAPEVVRNGEYSPASDRYAFGGLAYYVLTGTHPPTDPQQLRAGLATIAGIGDQPTTVDQLARIFAEDPSARPSAGQWLKALRLQTSTAPVQLSPLPPLASGHSVAAQAGQRPPEVRDGRGRGRRSTWIAATLAVVATAAVFLTLASTTTLFANSPSSETTRPPDSELTPQSPVDGPSASAPATVSDQGGDDGDDNETAAQTVWLVDLSPVDGGFGWETGSRTVTAETYERSVVGSTCSSSDDPEIAYNIGAAYTRFRAVVGNTDDAPTDVKTRFEVEVDDQTAFSRDLALGETAEVDVDVEGAIRLVLRVDSVGLTPCSLVAVWGDATLTG
jgi:serine/threonine protein kinase